LVFTMGVMIHLHPKEVRHAIGAIAKVSAKHIVHTEIATENYYKRSGKFTRQYGPRKEYLFLHDYLGRYKRTNFEFKEQIATVDGLMTMHFKRQK